MVSTNSLDQHQTSTGARVWRLPVEAFPNFWAYAYLVQVEDWVVLIDTGSGSESSNAGLEAGLAAAGVRPADLTHVLLTHGHIDHYGGLGFLRERTKALIGVHELDLGTITTHEARLAILSRKLGAFLAQAGIPAERRVELLRMYRFTKALYHSVPVDFTYEAHDMRIGPFELLHVPGHCPGHVALKLDDVVFCGDLVLEHVTPHQSPEELTPFMGVRHYLDSLSAFQRWADGAPLILNGHDDPISDLPAQIATLGTNLSRRIAQTLEALSEPRTLIRVTEQVYGAMNGYNALLVIEKIGAYVEFLLQRGLVEIVNSKELEDDPEAAIKYCRVELAPSRSETGAFPGVSSGQRPDGSANVLKSLILPKERAYVFIRTQ
jgi:glyoxylase-like metal-dependent hydrolase (beta-lactamase superfamily II)